VAERIRVLSIDGGGIRGIIPALVLAELERRAAPAGGRPVRSGGGHIDRGILALALAQPGRDGRPARTAEELVELYETEGPRIFARDLLQRIRSVEGLADERYSAEGLDRALKRYLGDTRLPDALTPVLVTAYDTAAREAVLLSRDDDLAMRDAARATAAAPTYFEALEPPGRRT